MMFRRVLIIAGFVTLNLLVVNCGMSEASETSEAAAKKDFRGSGFTITINTDVKAVVESPYEDFELYTFYRKDQLLSGIYAGNQPAFPKEAPKGTEQQTVQFNGQSFECYSWQTKNDQYSRECLFPLKGSFPQFLHFMYFDLDPENRNLADNIISSVVEK